MKRIQTILVVLLCLALALFSGCAGETEDKTTISAGEVTGAAGEEIKLPISITENSNLAAIKITVTFDPSKLLYVGYDHSETFSPDAKVGNLAAEGRFVYSIATLTPFTEAGDIITLKLKGAEGVTGKIPVNVEIESAVDSEHNPLDIKLVAGSVTIQ